MKNKKKPFRESAQRTESYVTDEQKRLCRSYSLFGDVIRVQKHRCRADNTYPSALSTARDCRAR